MRKFILVFTVAMVLGFAGSSQATLFDRGGGMIYDDNFNITWLQDANYAKTSGYDADGRMNWNQAVAWADQLVYGGYLDWRLPTTDPQVHSYNITSSEMGHLYYVDLGNKAPPEAGWGLKNTSFIDPGTVKTVSFLNMQPSGYWSSTVYEANPGVAWDFSFYQGFQFTHIKFSSLYALAVRTGDVGAPVPVPGTVLMLVPGLAGLFGKRWLKGRKHQG